MPLLGYWERNDRRRTEREKVKDETREADKGKIGIDPLKHEFNKLLKTVFPQGNIASPVQHPVG
jgi:hypothetical protein